MGDVEDNGANWRNSERRRFHTAGAVWLFEDEKDLKDDLEWQEKKRELNESDSDWQVSGDMLGDLSWVFYMWEKELYTEFFHWYWANEEI